MFGDSEYLNFFDARFAPSPQEAKIGEGIRKANEKYAWYFNSNCISLDEGIRKVTEELNSENQKILQSKGDTFYRDGLIGVKTNMEARFNGSDCRNKLELQKLVEGGKVITQSAIRQESEVLGKNEKEQYIYIAIGGTLLLVALFMITRK
jgi:hypothetical protein